MTRYLLVLAALSGCGPVLHREMLGESIRSFSARMKNGPEAKVWIAGPDDSSCDSGCFQGECGDKKKPKKSEGGGLFAPRSANAPSAQDALAYQVFANYLTQRKKARVLEPHRHNYATEGNVETHKKVEVLAHEGQKSSMMSCEDLCLLDEAKKRKADKLLAYYIGMISGTELIVHFRFSDVPTGLVEAAQTIKVKDLQAIDWSYGTGLGGSETRRPARESAGND